MVHPRRQGLRAPTSTAPSCSGRVCRSAPSSTRLSARWGLGEHGVRLLPMTDTPVETHVVVEQDGRAARDPLPGVVGQAPGRAARRALRRRGPRPGGARTGRPRRDPRAPTSSSCRRATPSSRSASSSACPGVRDALRGTTRPGRRGLAARRRPAGPRPRRRVPRARSASRRRAPASPGSTPTSSTAGSSTRRTRCPSAADGRRGASAVRCSCPPSTRRPTSPAPRSTSRACGRVTRSVTHRRDGGRDHDHAR